MTAQPTLAELASCFEGMIPSAVCTSSADGTPNVTWLSIVHRIDDSHVGLSFQFFNKTKANLLENPRAQVLVGEPSTGRQYRLDLAYERTELDGARFDRVRVQLDAIASQTGMTDVFRLRGLDIYRVLAIAKVPDTIEARVAMPQPDLDRIDVLGARLSQAIDLDSLVEVTLSSLASLLGYQHSMLLAADEHEGTLYTLASHGFEASGVGSDVRIGEGLIGVAAQSRLPVRVTNMARQLRYARAVRATVEPAQDAREIPLPGLPDAQSQLAMPLVAAGRLLGVLCLQSATAGRFQALDEQVVTIIGRQLAAAMLALGADVAIDPVAGAAAVAGEPPARVRHFAADDSVFIDDRYLIKGVAGRILWHLLRAFDAAGRAEFSNKELRVEPAIGLPGYRDNLEARLVLLRKRLEEHGAAIRLAPIARGRFRLVVARPIILDEVA